MLMEESGMALELPLSITPVSFSRCGTRGDLGQEQQDRRNLVGRGLLLGFGREVLCVIRNLTFLIVLGLPFATLRLAAATRQPLSPAAPDAGLQEIFFEPKQSLFQGWEKTRVCCRPDAMLTALCAI